MPEILGLDHIYITVSDIARSERYYDQVMDVFGFRKNRFTIDGDSHIQYYNRHFGYVLRPAHAGITHDPYGPGLHHLCFRLEHEEDVAQAAELLKAAGIETSAPAHYPEYASDYFAIFFTDPDGIRLEATNYRQERRQRHDHWDHCSEAGPSTPQGEP